MSDKDKIKDDSGGFSEFLLYKTPEGEILVEVLLQDETIWLSQKHLAELFGVDIRTISEHLTNIYKENELSQQATIRKFRIVQQEGNRQVGRNIDHYNLDAIIAVGYRVNSVKATRFRIWATGVLKEYIIKGFAIDDRRLKNGQYFGRDYFRELLERVRSIRASERRIYQQITDIFAECSIDYDSMSETTRQFYATVQNKFHYAITGNTAAEIVHDKADRTKPNMGLTSWKNSPDGRVLKSDVVIAKNYLGEPEIKKLERTISGFFDYIERLIENHNAFTMEQFAESVDKFLSFNEYRILDGVGKISHKQAEMKAIAEYDEYNKTQKIESDFDRATMKYLEDKTRNE